MASHWLFNARRFYWHVAGGRSRTGWNYRVGTFVTFYLRYGSCPRFRPFIGHVCGYNYERYYRLRFAGGARHGGIPGDYFGWLPACSAGKGCEGVWSSLYGLSIWRSIWSTDFGRIFAFDFTYHIVLQLARAIYARRVGSRYGRFVERRFYIEGPRCSLPWYFDVHRWICRDHCHSPVLFWDRLPDRQTTANSRGVGSVRHSGSNGVGYP